MEPDPDSFGSVEPDPEVLRYQNEGKSRVPPTNLGVFPREIIFSSLNLKKYTISKI